MMDGGTGLSATGLLKSDRTGTNGFKTLAQVTATARDGDTGRVLMSPHDIGQEAAVGKQIQIADRTLSLIRSPTFKAA